MRPLTTTGLTLVALLALFYCTGCAPSPDALGLLVEEPTPAAVNTPSVVVDTEVATIPNAAPLAWTYSEHLEGCNRGQCAVVREARLAGRSDGYMRKTNNGAWEWIHVSSRKSAGTPAAGSDRSQGRLRGRVFGRLRGCRSCG